MADYAPYRPFYLDALLGSPPATLLNAPEKVVAYLIGVQTRGTTAALSVAAFNVVMTAILAPSASDLRYYFPIYLKGYATALSVATSLDVSPGPAGPGGRVAEVQFCTNLGASDARTPDGRSTATTLVHPVIVGGGGPLNVTTGFTAPLLPGIVQIESIALAPAVAYTVRGLGVNGQVASETVQFSTLGGRFSFGTTRFALVGSLTSDVDPLGNVFVRQVVPIRSAANVIAALTAFFP